MSTGTKYNECSAVNLKAVLGTKKLHQPYHSTLLLRTGARDQREEALDLCVMRWSRCEAKHARGRMRPAANRIINNS